MYRTKDAREYISHLSIGCEILAGFHNKKSFTKKKKRKKEISRAKVST
jgi:hypothetical protein